jgi:DNA-binding response OmpR family regulator
MQKPKILIADSETMFAVAAAYVLEGAGYAVSVEHECEAALKQASRQPQDLLILDVGLSAADSASGSCLSRWRQVGERPPVILVLGKSREEGICVELLENGADDYLAKPFGMREFLARVGALLRRAQVPGEVAAKGELRCGPFKLDLEKLRLSVVTEAGPRSASLTPREGQIMEQLMRGAGEFVSREQISSQVWRDEPVSESTLNTLEVHLRSLRRKVQAASGQNWHIETKRGIGVRLMSALALLLGPASDLLEVAAAFV